MNSAECEMKHLDNVQERILELRRQVPAGQTLLVGISGVDASGKGYVAARLERALTGRLKVAVINVDGWLNLPQVRFSKGDPARNFYQNALRLDEMFETLILPVKQNGGIDLIADFLGETSTEYRPHRYVYNQIDIILLEGIFLFKRPYAAHFDLRIWIECGFETALRRAVARS